MAFVDSVSVTGDTDEDWRHLASARRDAELDSLITEENLKAEETRQFIEHAFRHGAIPTAGTAITRILPPASRLSKNNDIATKKQRVLDPAIRKRP